MSNAWNNFVAGAKKTAKAVAEGDAQGAASAAAETAQSTAEGVQQDAQDAVDAATEAAGHAQDAANDAYAKAQEVVETVGSFDPNNDPALRDEMHALAQDLQSLARNEVQEHQQGFADQTKALEERAVEGMHAVGEVVEGAAKAATDGVNAAGEAVEDATGGAVQFGVEQGKLSGSVGVNGIAGVQASVDGRKGTADASVHTRDFEGNPGVGASAGVDVPAGSASLKSSTYAFGEESSRTGWDVDLNPFDDGKVGVKFTGTVDGTQVFRNEVAARYDPESGEASLSRTIQGIGGREQLRHKVAVDIDPTDGSVGASVSESLLGMERGHAEVSVPVPGVNRAESLFDHGRSARDTVGAVIDAAVDDTVDDSDPEAADDPDGVPGDDEHDRSGDRADNEPVGRPSVVAEIVADWSIGEPADAEELATEHALLLLEGEALRYDFESWRLHRALESEDTVGRGHSAPHGLEDGKARNGESRGGDASHDKSGSGDDVTVDSAEGRLAELEARRDALFTREGELVQLEESLVGVEVNAGATAGGGDGDGLDVVDRLDETMASPSSEVAVVDLRASALAVRGEQAELAATMGRLADAAPTLPVAELRAGRDALDDSEVALSEARAQVFQRAVELREQRAEPVGEPAESTDPAALDTSIAVPVDRTAVPADTADDAPKFGRSADRENDERAVEPSVEQSVVQPFDPGGDVVGLQPDVDSGRDLLFDAPVLFEPQVAEPHPAEPHVAGVGRDDEFAGRESETLDEDDSTEDADTLEG